MSKIFVFYDARCGICLKEINYYKKKDLGKKFKWVDVNIEREELNIHGISFQDSLKYLHLIDQEGKTRIGVDAFITIWRELKYWKILSFFVNIQPIKFIVQIFYNFWARKRYEKLDYKCDV